MLLIPKKTKLNRKSTALSRAIILCLFLLFIGNQFYSVYFRWYNHPGPVGSGDSDSYISRIAYFKNHNFSPRPKLFSTTNSYYESNPKNNVKFFYDFHGLSSLFVLGKLASVMNISAERMLYYNFYIGIFIAGLIILSLLKQFGTYPLNVIVGLLVFMFYTGNGYYHGFFWVVPSFYCVLLWLLAIWVFFFSNRWVFYAPFVVLGLLFSHPSSIYCIIVLCLAIILNGLMEKKLAVSIKKTTLLLILLVSYFAIYGALLQKQIIFCLFTGEFDEMFLFGFVVPDYFINFLLLLAISGLSLCILRCKYGFIFLFIPTLLFVIVFYFIYIYHPHWALFLAAFSLLCAIYGIRQIIVSALANPSERPECKPSSFSNKCILFIIGSIIAISCALLFFKSALEAAYAGFKDLRAYTPFFAYFAGPLVPLTAAGIYFCFIHHQFKLLSLLLSTFLGTIIFCLIYSEGARTFLYLEIVLLFVIVYGAHQSVSLIWNNRRKISGRKGLSFYDKSIFSINGLMIALACGFVLLLFKTRIERDFGQKFYHPRFWQSEAMASFIQRKYDSDGILLLAAPIHTSPILSLDGWWNKKVYLPCTVPADADLDFFKKFVFIGENWKMYTSSRDGIGVFWPKTARIALNTINLLPGKYRITLSDTALNSKVFGNISIEARKNGLFKNVSSRWTQQPLTIKYPTENVYPPFMPPWYALAAKYVERIRPERMVIRETYAHSADFAIEEPTNCIFLNNTGDTVNLMGKVEIFLKSQNKSVFTLDLDYGKTESLQTKPKLNFNGKNYPLLWKDPRFGLKYNLPCGKTSEVLLTLERNFGDIKVFRLFKEPLQLQRDL